MKKFLTQLFVMFIILTSSGVIAQANNFKVQSSQLTNQWSHKADRMVKYQLKIVVFPILRYLM